MKRILFFIYGTMSYFLFFGTFLYFIGFLGNLFVPNAIDGPVEVDTLTALLINIGLVLIFGVQHSVMARKSFKEWSKSFIHPVIERSTYILASTLALALLMAYWQPMGGIVWSIESPIGVGIIYGVFALGWGILFLATFLLDHFELFGLKQVYFHLIGKDIPKATFKTPLLYKLVRHPIYLGFTLSVWATPTMTITHLVLAIGITTYAFAGAMLEEKDLIAEFGERYKNYRKRVPMILPLPWKYTSPPKATQKVKSNL